jgi:hypothetical protein
MIPRRLLAVVLALCLAASGCASTGNVPVVPLQDQGPEQIQRDRDECEAIARQDRDRLVLLKTKAAMLVVGLVVGIGLGLIAAVMSGTSGTREAGTVLAGGAIVGGAVGLVAGEVGGTVVGVQEHRRSETAYLDRYVRCLSARGYRTAP